MQDTCLGSAPVTPGYQCPVTEEEAYIGVRSKHRGLEGIHFFSQPFLKGVQQNKWLCKRFKGGEIWKMAFCQDYIAEGICATLAQKGKKASDLCCLFVHISL